MKYDHFLLIKIHAVYLVIRDKKEMCLVWFPGHSGISDNSAAGSAAEDVFDGVG